VRKSVSYFLCYLSWIITGAVGFLGLIASRELCPRILAALSFDRWAAGAIDKFSFLIFSIIWLILVMFSEHYYREGILKKKLGKRFSLITSFQLFSLFLVHSTSFLIYRLRGFGWQHFLITGFELGVGLIFLFFALHPVKHSPRG